jgi:hypothetical protein
MADIFISFIHEDEKVADGVKRFLYEKLELNSKGFLASDKWAIADSSSQGITAQRSIRRGPFYGAGGCRDRA